MGQRNSFEGSVKQTKEDKSNLKNELVLSDNKELSEKLNRMDDEQLNKVNQLKEGIETLDNEGLIVYGVEAQDNLTKFSDTMLDEVRDTDLGEIGDSLESLMKKLKMIDPEELNKKPNFIQKIFKKVKTSVEDLILKHNTISNDVDNISLTLMNSKDGLVNDVRMLDGLYEENRKYYDEIDLYITAGELKLDEINNKELIELQKEAKETNNQMVVQNYNDLVQYSNRLDKRLHDLKLSRQIVMQSAPQIRMVQDINQTLAEKIQSSVLTSIPLWKNQMAISISLLRQESASKSQKAVTDTTNELLVRNSEMLKMNSISSAKENERGIVDVETLKLTQNNLVETIEETLRIQHEGTAKRKEVEAELGKMETELKDRLLEVKDKYNK